MEIHDVLMYVNHSYEGELMSVEKLILNNGLKLIYYVLFSYSSYMFKEDNKLTVSQNNNNLGHKWVGSETALYTIEKKALF